MLLNVLQCRTAPPLKKIKNYLTQNVSSSWETLVEDQLPLYNLKLAADSSQAHIQQLWQSKGLWGSQ